jgi:hypothetical protein
METGSSLKYQQNFLMYNILPRSNVFLALVIKTHLCVDCLITCETLDHTSYHILVTTENKEMLFLLVAATLW